MTCEIKDYTIEDIKKWIQKTNDIIDGKVDSKDREIIVYTQLGLANGLFQFILLHNGGINEYN